MDIENHLYKMTKGINNKDTNNKRGICIIHRTLSLYTL